MLVCEGCHKTKRVPFRWKGRFCTTCSCGETEEWSRIMSEGGVTGKPSSCHFYH
ncbi:hypothetical protein ACI7RC_27060 [Brevibacillus sp. B_LB10_24]|uniref:hypothetical protein n=1 Tax=Brevibacillus sp. B_LB10_24 TaxID=3380645 RepID=UPI0038B9AFF2